MEEKYFYSIILKILFFVLQLGQTFNFFISLGLVDKHITHSSVLNILSILITFLLLIRLIFLYPTQITILKGSTPHKRESSLQAL